MRCTHLEELRVVESLGPYPVQPIVIRATMSVDDGRRLATRLLDLHRDPGIRRTLAGFGVQRFAPVQGCDYEPHRAILRACEARLARCRNGEEAA